MLDSRLLEWQVSGWSCLYSLSLLWMQELAGAVDGGQVRVEVKAVLHLFVGFTRWVADTGKPAELTVHKEDIAELSRQAYKVLCHA